jgi:hypothetical protein
MSAGKEGIELCCKFKVFSFVSETNIQRGMFYDLPMQGGKEESLFAPKSSIVKFTREPNVVGKAAI